MSLRKPNLPNLQLSQIQRKTLLRLLLLRRSFLCCAIRAA
jgi:hypothetical protein